MFEFNAHAPEAADDLFLERLEAFMDKSLVDIKAFSERELRPFEETRRYVAEWHARYLFQCRPSPPSPGPSSMNKGAQVRSVLCDVSRILEELYETASVQTFLLALNPSDPSDEGFLGGSVTAREFWRGYKGSGGEAGAKAFKHYCLRETESKPSDDIYGREGPSNQTTAGLHNAKSLKTELYENVRKALRSSSGIRNAEMKWTNPERLDIYGVRLVGWPTDIPAQNPSSLKQHQNRQLLESLESGTMRFEKTMATDFAIQHTDDPYPSSDIEITEDFSWAYDAEGGAVSDARIIIPSDIKNPFASWDGSSTRDISPCSANDDTAARLPVSSVIHQRGTHQSSKKRPRSASQDLQTDPERASVLPYVPYVSPQG